MVVCAYIIILYVYNIMIVPAPSSSSSSRRGQYTASDSERDPFHRLLMLLYARRQWTRTTRPLYAGRAPPLRMSAEQSCPSF